MGRADEHMHSTYEQLCSHVLDKLEASKNDEGRQLWIGIAGAPASGKSSLTENVATLLRNRGIPAAVIPMDGYHYYKSELDAMEHPQEKHKRRGAHWTFNADRFVSELMAAKAGRAGIFPSFDHGKGDPVEGDLALKPDDRVVLVEGNYILLWDVTPWGQLKHVFDETWFVDVDLDTARTRIIKRHMAANGNTYEVAAWRADNNDIPNGKVVAETRKFADLVVQSI